MIVVAIIAVLVAIAVPLFVGALNDAEEKVKTANVRAVRGAAVAKILSNGDTYLTVEDSGSTVTAHSWTIVAEVDAGGNITTLTITASKDATEDSLTCEKDGEVYNVTGTLGELSMD